MRSSRKAATTPQNRPRNNPTAAFIGTFGLEGDFGAPAGRMT